MQHHGNAHCGPLSTAPPAPFFHPIPPVTATRQFLTVMMTMTDVLSAPATSTPIISGQYSIPAIPSQLHTGLEDIWQLRVRAQLRDELPVTRTGAQPPLGEECGAYRNINAKLAWERGLANYRPSLLLFVKPSSASIPACQKEHWTVRRAVSESAVALVKGFLPQSAVNVVVGNPFAFTGKSVRENFSPFAIMVDEAG
ncbi:hypothetical protein BDV18DRAFT_158039 [Aspergillus unguis]